MKIYKGDEVNNKRSQEGDMSEVKKEAKERIFDAALALFAKKGFHGVGMREIAHQANVQVSMINYYYDGKVGILKEIINICYDRYYKAILDTGDDSMDLEQRVRYLAKNMVHFFKDNTEMAIVALSTMPVDIPEILDLKVKWIQSHRDATNKWFETLNIDMSNEPLMSVIRGLLTSIIFGFVESQYSYKHIVQTPSIPIHIQENIVREDGSLHCDDAFYDKYVEYVAQLYLYGVSHLSKIHKKKE